MDTKPNAETPAEIFNQIMNYMEARFAELKNDIMILRNDNVMLRQGQREVIDKLTKMNDKLTKEINGSKDIVEVKSELKMDSVKLENNIKEETENVTINEETKSDSDISEQNIDQEIMPKEKNSETEQPTAQVTAQEIKGPKEAAIDLLDDLLKASKQTQQVLEKKQSLKSKRFNRMKRKSKIKMKGSKENIRNRKWKEKKKKQDLNVKIMTSYYLNKTRINRRATLMKKRQKNLSNLAKKGQDINFSPYKVKKKGIRTSQNLNAYKV